MLVSFLALFIGVKEAASLGLGSFAIFSYLDEPLYGEIDVMVVPQEDTSDLSVTLGSQEDFDRFNVPFQSLLLKLDFQLRSDEMGNYAISVTSKEPIRSGYLRFILTINSKTGKISKEFSALIDPVGYRDDFQRIPLLNKNKDILVTASDTLWQIAENLRLGPSLTTEQVMMAIFSQNPTAFIDSNMNSLMTGVTLSIPSKVTIEKISAREARDETVRQYKSWKGEKQIESASREIISEPAGDQRLQLLTPEQPLVSSSTEPLDLTIQENKLIREVESMYAEETDKSNQLIDTLKKDLNARNDEIKSLKSKVEELNILLKDNNSGAAALISQTEEKSSSIVMYVLPLLLLALIASYILFQKKRKNVSSDTENLSFLSDSSGSESNSSISEKELDSADNTVSLPVEKVHEQTFEQKVDKLAGLNVYLAYERYDDAIALCETALKDEPESILYRERYQEVLLASGEIEKFFDSLSILKETLDQNNPMFDRLIEQEKKAEELRGNKSATDNIGIRSDLDSSALVVSNNSSAQEPDLDLDLDLDSSASAQEPDLDLDLDLDLDSSASAQEPDLDLDVSQNTDDYNAIGNSTEKNFDDAKNPKQNDALDSVLGIVSIEEDSNK